MPCWPPLLLILTAPLGAWAQAVPDTTATARYLPLHVGDAWEYYSYRDAVRLRRAITGDTVVDGRAYVLLADYRAEPGTPPELLYRNPVRFDTLAGLAMEPFGDGTGREAVADYLTVCPLGAPRGSTVTCSSLGPAAVGGGPGLIVFGGELPGTGTDTVAVTVKTFTAEFLDIEHRYAADLGLVYVEDVKGVGALGLYFARVDGVEHGVEQYPGVGVRSEPAPAAASASVAVMPNPVAGSATVRVALPESRPARVAVYDVLGREVACIHEGMLAVGLHEFPLNTSLWAPGIYVVRAAGGAWRAATRLVVR